MDDCSLESGSARLPRAARDTRDPCPSAADPPGERPSPQAEMAKRHGQIAQAIGADPEIYARIQRILNASDSRWRRPHSERLKVIVSAAVFEANLFPLLSPGERPRALRSPQSPAPIYPASPGRPKAPVARRSERHQQRRTRGQVEASRRFRTRLRKAAFALLWSLLAHGLLVILLDSCGVWEKRPAVNTLVLQTSAVEPPLQELEPLPLTMSADELSPAPAPSSLPETVDSPLPMMDSIEPVALQPEVQSPAAPLAGVGRDMQGLLESIPQKRSSRGGPAATTFFGVEAQGEAVCFMIDSSRSMRGKFDLARGEVVRSIAEMKPRQRFYVLLFDQNVERMRLGDQTPSQPVEASEANKRALWQWLRETEMESSCDPVAALDAALGLDADSLYLLTDGELPESLLEMLRNRNQRRVENQVVVAKSIHTIGLHSLRGRELLARIAHENGGVYRFIPKPPR